MIFCCLNVAVYEFVFIVCADDCQAEMLATMQMYPNLRLVEASVEDIALSDETLAGSVQNEETQLRSARVRGVITKEGGLIEAGRVVITTGTFLRGWHTFLVSLTFQLCQKLYC